MREDVQRQYYLQRASTCLDLARHAADPSIALVHMDFYELYMERAGEPPLAPRKPQIVSSHRPRR